MNLPAITVYAQAIPTMAIRPLLNRLGLVFAVCFALVGCGSASSAPVASAPTQAAAPTPVPTTAPLSLPPADDSLPALAPLPASVVASAPTTEASEVAGSVDESDDSESEATAAIVEPTEPTEPPAIVEAQPEPAAVQAVATTDQWSDCLLLAATSTQAGELLDPISTGATTDMSSVQLNSLAAASVGCDMVSVGLGATDIGAYVPTAATCMNAWLESSAGGSVFVGLASVGWSQPIPAWAQAHFVDAVDACFTGASFAADIMSVVSADSALTGAFDAGCLGSSFDSSGTLRSFAQSLANNPATATIPVSLSDAWVLRCANVGQMVAVAAAADGVALSDSTISCIDSELKGTGVVARLIGGTADTDAVGIATIACLTDAEAAALLG